jgi:hypothetical protein
MPGRDGSSAHGDTALDLDALRALPGVATVHGRNW